MADREELFKEMARANAEVEKWTKRWRRYVDRCLEDPARIDRFNPENAKMLDYWDEYQNALARQREIWEQIEGLPA